MLIDDDLNDSAELYYVLFNTSLDAVFLTQQDGMIERANQAACRMFGRTVEEFREIGRNGIIDVTDPRFSGALEERQKTGEFFGELIGIRSDGTKFPVELSSALFTTKDGKTQISSIFRDITDRKRAENELTKWNELLSLFIKHSPIHSFIKDVSEDESRVLFASENYDEMIGVKGSDMVGKNMYELFPEEFAKKITADDLNVVLKGELLRLEEDLNNRNYRTIKFPIKQEDKTFLAGYTIDLTDLRNSEKLIRENETRLRELNATKDKFFSIIAHDIRGPFSSIIGFSHLLVDQIEEENFEDVKKYAKIILKSSEDAMDLLKNLQIWSTLQRGNITFKPLFFDLVVLVKEITDIFTASAQLKSISILSLLPPSYLICGDEEMISTILRNLISNAVKFTRPGGQIFISTEDNPKEWTVCVRDTGIGIELDDLEKLFRIESSHSTFGTLNEKGTGLGLILCKDFVKLHEGKIWVKSKIEQGSSFFFTIPKCL